MALPSVAHLSLQPQHLKLPRIRIRPFTIPFVSTFQDHPTPICVASELMEAAISNEDYCIFE